MTPEDSNSETEMDTAEIKKPMKKITKTETVPKKKTVKVMIHQALKELTGNSRKGVSLQAIKKYMVECYNVDIDKLNFHIKKTIKMGVESGEILQTKGVGASGSFRMAAKSKEKTKAENPKKIEEPNVKVNEPKSKEKVKKIVEKKTEKKEALEAKSARATIPQKKEKMTKKNVEKEVKPKRSKAGKESKIANEPAAEATGKEKVEKPKVSKKTKGTTAAKNRESIIKRKSIGSIIKPPKMKPKARN